ncbi:MULTISPECIES: PaaX family transcriptional regulator C-terminal domain-containing protein [Streptomyces]|uniref:PaaX family transcriptional regulator C-terminal domain-containing protein n=1 Tax=Streptomyces TaxID=1883 RepID=UPI001673AA77|nr:MULTISPECIES: PaaX family transcriptional regulator C-terminal domain-containing protein [Streptomyces]MBD3574957.1 transcriptional regulator [Streptomyces sp. KD18]GGT24348.1 putative repressor in the phenylacetic acid catabolism [Streptomyces toxytricini]
MTSRPAGAPAAEPAPPAIGTRTLVFALVREDGTVDAGELYAVAESLGMTDQQVRLCLKRLAAEGRFTQEGRGRKAVLRAAADPAGAIAPDAEYVRHAYLQDEGLAPWDGTWHLFAFAIPEASRQARDSLRDTLLHLGAAPLQGGLYASANAIGDIVEAHARGLGVLPSLTRLTSRDLRVGDEDAPERLAALLWPLREVADRHEALAALAADRLARLAGPNRPTETERLTYAIELAASFTAAMEPDPLLPPELLPQPWAGTRARALAARCWTALAADGTGGERGELRLFRLYDGAFPAS